MALRVQPVKKALDTIAEASRGEEKNDLDAVAFKGAHLIVVAACLDDPGSFDQIVPMVLGPFFPLRWKGKVKVHKKQRKKKSIK